MKPFLVLIEREESGALLGTIHTSALKDAMEVFEFEADVVRSEETSPHITGFRATMPSIRLFESADGPRIAAAIRSRDGERA